MHHERRFFLLCSVITGVSLLAAILPAPAILRIGLALPLVFVLPGMALLRALGLRFTRSAQAPIVVGISMAITVLGGLALDWLGGLTPLGWAAWLGGFSTLAAGASRAGDAGVHQPLPAIRIRHGVMLAAAAAILLLTFQGTLRNVAAKNPFPHTSFWMLPLAPASDVYLIGIKNDEGRPEIYGVQLMVDRRTTGEWQDLNVPSGHTVTFPVMVQTGAPAEAWLYRAEQPDAIYRRVTVAGRNDFDGAAISDTADEAQ
jgi:hypothetical protein